MSRAQQMASGTLGERLRAARRRLGMSQDELGAVVGVSQPAISRLEYGSSPPERDTIARLAAALGVAPEWLLGTAAAAPNASTNRDEFGSMTRLQALAEYRELLDRRSAGEALPGDPRRGRGSGRAPDGWPRPAGRRISRGEGQHWHGAGAAQRGS